MLILSGFALSASIPTAYDVSHDHRIKPPRLGLPSEPFVARVYKMDNIWQVLQKQPFHK